MAPQETSRFVLQSHARHVSSLDVCFSMAEDGITAALTIAEQGGRTLFSSPRVSRRYVSILQGIYDMETRADSLPKGDIHALGCHFIARSGRMSLARTLQVEELAQYD